GPRALPARGGGADQARTARAASPAAAVAAYERRFGHAFVVCLDGCRADEAPGRALAALRARLRHGPEEERAVAARELRRLTRERLVRLTDIYSPEGGSSTFEAFGRPDGP
ncbi:2-oxo-4-hydroxy-4-carboxy-5-ureidoimidazoline decarboxylase, partial [Streptomyces sp. B1866]|uniref:2-oxo-4-hydroxy-4-carboxy-5-ureidoimidazoline decarboxylase n=1 Tax=Streptomyces sp. B1866 TaxID=3075431 RepID=UPI0028917078